MTSSASSTGSSPAKTRVAGDPPMSNTIASSPYSSDPIEGSSKATNDRPEDSKTSKTSHNRTSSESSRLSAHPCSPSFKLSQNAADRNRDSEQSTKAGTANKDDNQYNDDNESDNDNETIRAIAKRHSSSRSSHTNMYRGRHSKDWLFKPLAKKAKKIFGGKE